MKRKGNKYRPYRKSRTVEEERQSWEEEKKRLEFRLSHPSECFINSVRQEEMELAVAIERLPIFDEIGEDLPANLPETIRLRSKGS
jgi:hypothetical protein